MNNCIKIFLIVIFFSSCSILDKKNYGSNSLEEIYLNQNIFNKNYIGMTKNQIIHIFGMPIISDSFSDVYHYYLYNDERDENIFQKKMLNLYFRDDKVLKFNIR